jgi:hypothetical protein
MTSWWFGEEEWQQRGGARWPGRAQGLSCRLGRRKLEVEGRRRTGNVVAPTLCGQAKAEDLAGQGQRRAAERNIAGGRARSQEPGASALVRYC